MSKQLFIKSLVLPVLLALFTMSANAQKPGFKLYITNEAQLSPTEYQFDLYLLSTDTMDLQLADFQAGITVNPDIINGGTITATIVEGSSTLNNPSQIPTPEKVNFNNKKNILNIIATIPPGYKYGSLISRVDSAECYSPGTRIGTFVLTNTTAFTVGLSMNHTFNFTLGGGQVATKVFAYVWGVNTNISDRGIFFDYDEPGTCEKNIILGRK